MEQPTRQGKPIRLDGWLQQIAEPEALNLAVRSIRSSGTEDQVISLDLRLRNGAPVACRIYEPKFQPLVEESPAADTANSETSVVPPPLLLAVDADPVVFNAQNAEADRDPPQRVWRVVAPARRPRAPAWVVGSMVHEALARWRFPDATFERWAEARCRHYGLADAAQTANAYHETAKLLQRFQAHALYTDMSGADRRLHEVPYSLIAENGHVESGIVDALYRRAGSWTVVEFKTDEIRSEAKLQELLAETGYLAQAGRYATAVERLLGSRPAVVLCFLDYAGEVHVHRFDGG